MKCFLKIISYPEFQRLPPRHLLHIEEIIEQLQPGLFEYFALYGNDLAESDKTTPLPGREIFDLRDRRKWLQVIVFQAPGNIEAPLHLNVKEGTKACSLAGKGNMLPAIAPAQLITSANAQGLFVIDLISN